MTTTQPPLKNISVKRQRTSSKSRTHALAQHFGFDGLINSNNERSLMERNIHSQQLQQQHEQYNIETIFKLTYDQCNNETTTEPDPDWLVRFINMAKQVYSPSMQKLWAQILKKELIYPGSTSLRALTILISMTHKEALLFQRVMSVSCQVNNNKDRKVITSIKTTEKIIYFGTKSKSYPIEYHQYALPYSSIIILMDLGLILKTELESSKINHTQNIQLHFKTISYTLSCHNKNTSLTYYRISPTGQELASLIDHNTNTKYQDYLLSRLIQVFTITTSN
ncbi:TIGR03899 family protein [Photobacterium sp. S4TG1]|uniref:TIGR03899 family protein n=1 Tax=Photobacterium sp. S4TG1 TaxID=3114587 RepID=UPI002E19F10A|nr:TIGR03899 family protein [Photobacterium sp. S4TG1]